MGIEGMVEGLKMRRLALIYCFPEPERVNGNNFTKTRLPL